MQRGRHAPIPRPFFMVSLANFVFFLNVAFFFLLPLWILKHGGGEEVAGRVAGAQGFAGLAVLPLVGWLLDRFGRRRVLLTGTLVGAACAMAYTRVESIGPSLYALRIAQGVAFTCAFTSAQTLAVLYAPPERRAEAIGWFGISTILTHAISPAVGEEIIRRWSFDAMFTIAAALSALAFVISCTLPRPPALRTHGNRDDIDPVLARKAVGIASFSMVCYGFGFGATQTFVPVLIQRFALGRVGTFFLAWSLAAVAMRFVFGGAADRYGRRKVLIPAMFTMSFALLLLAVWRSPVAMPVIGVVFGMAQGLLYPTMNALVADWSKPGNIGRTQSLFSGSYSLGIASCSFFFGSIAEHHGYTVMFLVALAITLVGLAAFVAGPKEIRVQAHDTPVVPSANPEVL
jgi:MFS family permease